MKTKIPWLFPSKTSYVLILTFILAASLGTFSLIQPQTVWADGGGFPTSTRTITPTATATITSVPTSTNLPPLVIINTPTSAAPYPIETQALPLVQQEAETPPSSRLSTFLCWPFAVVIIIITVLASSMLIRRQR
jgi:hypothetical protein